MYRMFAVPRYRPHAEATAGSNRTEPPPSRKASRQWAALPSHIAARMLRNIEGLQREIEKDPHVGKSFSVVDYVKRINRVLHNDDSRFDRVPDSADEVGQYLFCSERRPN